MHSSILYRLIVLVAVFALPVSAPEPRLVRARMLLRRARDVRAAAFRHRAAPDDVASALHCGPEQLVLKIAVKKPGLLPQREPFLRLGQGARLHRLP